MSSSSSVSPASSPARPQDRPVPPPLPFLVSSSAAPTAAPGSNGAVSSAVHTHEARPSLPSTLQLSWDGSAPPSSVSGTLLPGQDGASSLIRFLPIAEPGNGPQEALDRMRRLAHLSDQQRLTATDGASSHSVVVSNAKYTTSADIRGYIPVLEFPLGEQVLMIDSENGLVHWTSIWKLLGNSKADMVRLVEMQPEVGALLKKVRGGYLKIQGTWLPYDIALNLARRVAYPIRHDLEPLFGPAFPASCLAPSQPGFGQITLSAPGTSTRRGRQKRPAAPIEPRRPPATPSLQTNAQAIASQYRRASVSTAPSGSVRVGAPADGRYAPYPTFVSVPTPQMPLPSAYHGHPQVYAPFGLAHAPDPAAMYPAASTQYYPPPPPTADIHPSLGTYRFPPAPPPPPSEVQFSQTSAQPVPSPSTSVDHRRPSTQARKNSVLSITQLLDGETPPDTPFSLPLPLVGSRFASPISGDQQQLSMLDGAVVPRRGSQQFKRLLGERDDWTPPSTSSTSAHPHGGYFRRDSIPSPLRTTLPGLSLSDRHALSPPHASSVHLSSVDSTSQRLPLTEPEQDDDALSAHSSGVSSPRTTDDAHPPIVIRTGSRDDMDDRSRQGSFNSALGVFLGPADGAASAWGNKAATTDAGVRFPSISSSDSSTLPSFPIPGAYATASRAAEARRHSASDQRASSSTVQVPLDRAAYIAAGRSSLSQQSSLPTVQQSPLRPW